jgi:hypothetical protein
MFIFVSVELDGMSDLSLLMAFVKLNKNNKSSISVAMRVLSALPGKEKERFPIYFKELIYWAATDENVGDILENLKVQDNKD